MKTSFISLFIARQRHKLEAVGSIPTIATKLRSRAVVGSLGSYPRGRVNLISVVRIHPPLQTLKKTNFNVYSFFDSKMPS